jgi:hypothetical protein
MQTFSSKYTAREIEDLLTKARKMSNAVDTPTVTYGTFKLKRYIKNYNGYIPEIRPIYGKAILPEEPAAVTEE